MKKQQKQNKRKVENGLSDLQLMFASAIDYAALDRALQDPQVVEILNKIKL